MSGFYSSKKNSTLSLRLVLPKFPVFSPFVKEMPMIPTFTHSMTLLIGSVDALVNEILWQFSIPGPTMIPSYLDSWEVRSPSPKSSAVTSLRPVKYPLYLGSEVHNWIPLRRWSVWTSERMARSSIGSFATIPAYFSVFTRQAGLIKGKSSSYASTALVIIAAVNSLIFLYYF